jgi:hypothetical protein
MAAREAEKRATELSKEVIVPGAGCWGARESVW